MKILRQKCMYLFNMKIVQMYIKRKKRKKKKTGIITF